MSRLSDYYKNEVAPALMKKFEYKSPMQIPKIEKIILNIGAGDAKDNAKVIDNIMADLETITGQKAVPTFARKSVANFKIREGMKIGAKVTLRGEKMYEFMDRFFNLALPRVRDFKGINPNAFDEMAYQKGKLYLAGSFNQALPFDNTNTRSWQCCM